MNCNNPQNNTPHEIVPNNIIEFRTGFCIGCQDFDGWSHKKYIIDNKISIKDGKVYKGTTVFRESV